MTTPVMSRTSREEKRDIHVFEFARHDQSVVTNQRFPRGPDSLLAVRSQWNITRAGMFARQRPLGLTMADNETAWCSHDILAFVRIYQKHGTKPPDEVTEMFTLVTKVE